VREGRCYVLMEELELTPGIEVMARFDAHRELLTKRRMHICCNSFANPANAQIHRETTAEEIWSDTDGQVDIMVAGVGTGGYQCAEG